MIRNLALACAGTAGSVQVIAAGLPGTPLTVDVSGVTFSEIDPATLALKAGGCTAGLAHINLTGTTVDVMGGGGGGI